jgi:hypothetical protein
MNNTNNIKNKVIFGYTLSIIFSNFILSFLVNFFATLAKWPVYYTAALVGVGSYALTIIIFFVMLYRGLRFYHALQVILYLICFELISVIFIHRSSKSIIGSIIFYIISFAIGLIIFYLPKSLKNMIKSQ